MSIDDLWYKNAVIYCLDVTSYMDANGDGVGDFEGLSRRLEYLAGLGVTCLWLQPFYGSPGRDNGYDVADYYAVNPQYGTLGDFVEFANHAQSLGLRVLVDLVASHTSNEHPWFKSARSDPNSPYRDWYVWSRKRPENHDEGIVFPGVQDSTWSYDDVAEQYYFHRFYDFQPDLNTHNSKVLEEVARIMGFWLQLGVSGFRMDAVPFFIERKGADVEPERNHDLLRMLREFLQWRRRDAIMLAEANVPPDESLKYFGQRGEHMQMMLNFPVNQRLFYALATAQLGPLREALTATADRPPAAQWTQFLRSHDECDLGRLTDEQREAVFAAFAPEEHMQLYHRGIRRRLAPMLGNDRRRLDLAYSLMFSLPGTPMLYYGEEIGMGDDLSLPERTASRTPMQWSGETHAGFSKARNVYRPVIRDGQYGYQRVNVADQRRDRNSLLNYIEQLVRARRECAEISWGKFEIIDAGAQAVLAMRYDWRSTSLVTLHNFSDGPCTALLSRDAVEVPLLADVFRRDRVCADGDGVIRIQLGPYGHRWYRVGGEDTALQRFVPDIIY